MDKKPTNDAELKTALDKLFNDWRKAVSFGDKFVEDGALPGYFDQKFKILFIGRESRGCIGDDLLHELECILSGQSSWKAGNVAMWVAYGLTNDIENWDDIPGIPEGVSFAFINLSKFAHLDGKGSQLSPHFVGYVYESLGENTASRNFTREEIDSLEPDLIVTWNLGGFCNFVCETSQGNKLKNIDEKNVKIWTYKSSTGRKIPVLDSWSFSAADWKKDAKTEIYEPIRNAAKKLGLI